MLIILPRISPAEAAREKRLLREAADEVLASPRLMDEFLKKLGLDINIPPNPSDNAV